ncbi:MAG TPA: PqqD family protein [Burkholderiales bacterium]|nr:PqqD family protein [Burkholderiales bacterium]
MDARNNKPRARNDDRIIRREVDSELIVYDSTADKAHCLNDTAARVWRVCDGRNTVTEIAAALATDLKTDVREHTVWQALMQLEKAELLEEPVVPPELVQQLARREAVRTLAFASVVAVPLVASIVAPTPAQAASPPPP